MLSLSDNWGVSDRGGPTAKAKGFEVEVREECNCSTGVVLNLLRGKFLDDRFDVVLRPEGITTPGEGR